MFSYKKDSKQFSFSQDGIKFSMNYLCYQMCSISMLHLHNTLDSQSIFNYHISFDCLNHMGGY